MKFEDWIAADVAKPTGGYNDVMDELDYKEHYYPWAKYIIDMRDPFPDDSFEMLSWCEKNCKGRYEIEFYAYFELEEDSVLFALRWS